MSLEAALDANTAALNKVAGLLEISNAGREAAIAAATTLQSGEGAKPRASRKPAGEAAPATSAAPAGPPSEEDVRSAFGGYMGVEDPDERAARKVNVKAILEKFGVAKATEVPEANRAQAIAWVNTFAKGETPAEFAAPPAEDPEDDLMG